MNKSTRIIIIFFLFLFCSTELRSQVLIPITTTRNKTQLLVRVGSSRDLRIILDSGMAFDGILIYNPDLRDSIKLVNPIEAQVGGAGSGRAAQSVFSDSMSFFIGNKEFTDQRIIILNNNSFKGFPSDGVLGYTILGHYATELNYDEKILTLHEFNQFEVDESWEKIPIYFKNNNIPWIDVRISTVENKFVTISTYIDFASGDAIELLLRDKLKFTIPENLEEAYLGRGLSGDIYGKKGRISKLILGKYEINDVPTVFSPAQVRSKQDNADGIIGNAALMKFNLIFNYKDKVLYLKPNSRFDKPFSGYNM